MIPKKKTNKTEGLRREDTMRRILEETYGKGHVLSERMLYNKKGIKETAGKSGKESGRRIEFIVLDNISVSLLQYYGVRHEIND